MKPPNNNEYKCVLPQVDLMYVPIGHKELVKPQFSNDILNTNLKFHPDMIRCTLTAIPQSKALLKKCRLPLGIFIHPFKDIEPLKVNIY
jgi:hypothetical protein